jgi:pimeloyl-ACP methyl ester carboxylesterase
MCPIPPRGIVSLSGPVLRASWRYLPRMVAGRRFRPRRPEAERIVMNRLGTDDRDRWYPRFLEDSGAAARQIATGAVSVDPANVTAPVLVVSATEDRISPPALQPKMVLRYGAEHRPFDGHAHLITLEPGWEAPAGAVLDWARSAIDP